MTFSFYFFDTSALVKRFHDESGSAVVHALFAEQDSTIIISDLTIIELTSALRRTLQRGEITRDAFDNALAQFGKVLQDELIVAGFRSGFVQAARDLVIQYGIRTLDALQLTSAMQFQNLSPVFVCADAQLLRAATAVGFATLNPEAEVS